MSSTAVGIVTWEDTSKEPPDRGSVLIPANKTVLVGRDEARNHIAFADPVVSRSQLEIFSIVVDEEGKHPPLVFVRDRVSSNGTAVNGQLIGKGAKLSPSRLLENGDVITIGRHPHLTLKVQLSQVQSSYILSPTQQQEVELFKDRYVVIDRTIGEGGHAVVFLAKEVETGQHVVCKVHDISRFSQTSRVVERIRQEAALLSTLDHPNILPVKAAFETQQTIYVIMELATGGDLFSLLLRYNRLADWAIRSIIRQVLRGVTYLHSKGVAHRDIKPENVLCGVTPQVPYRIMLADFGDSGIAGPQRMKSAVGTRFYRPPECAAPDHHHDLSVDIWAVGMLTLQLFLGYQELPGLDSVVFKNQEDIDEYLDLTFSGFDPQLRISQAAKDFIRRCLVYDSARRPTARQAFYHAWLQEPKSDRETFKRLEAESALLWKPQWVKFPVIETLKRESTGMDKRHGSYANNYNAPKDSVSPHFMDRKQVTAALRPRTHSKGKCAAVPTTPIGHDTMEQKKRKDMAPVTGGAKRLKSSPT